MNVKTFFLVFCLTIVILGVVTSSASALDNKPVTTILPTVYAISPASGTTAGGVTITIVGTGFTGARGVTIGGATATGITVTNDAEITAITPANAVGSANVLILTPNGTATGTYTYVTQTPIVTAISTSSGTTLGGTVVTITGSGFTDLTNVMFGTSAATSYTFYSDSSISATSPNEAIGTVDITVVTPSGTSAVSTADEFTYTAATTSVPTVTSISPIYGPVSVATPITITGTGFTGATGVTVGGTAATSVVVVSSTEITATTPASSTVGQVDVLVTTPGGTSPALNGDEYTFAATATTVPVPIFSASPTYGLAPLSVQFTDESTGSPATWSWNFGDGNTSTLENPANTYANNGTYTVTLTEQNSLGTNITTETGYIIVGGSALAADFTATPTSGTVPLTVQFTDTSTGSPTTWLWDFGDGTTGSAQNPSHIYTSPGTYSVSLIASNGAGSNTFSQPAAITVSSVTVTYMPAPTAVDTFAIPAKQKASDSSNAAWLAQQNAMSAAMAVTATPASGLPPVIPLIALVCVALVIRRKYH